MKRSHNAIIASLLLAALAVAEVALPVRFSNDQFSASFPSEVKESTDHGKTEKADAVPFTSYLYGAADSKTGEMYFVSHVDYDRAITFNLDEGLNGSRDRVYSSVDSDDRGDSTLGGLRARYALFAGSGKGGGIKFNSYERIAFDGHRRVWMVMVISQHSLDKLSYNKFAESLAVK